MAVRIQFRRGTAAEWAAANPTLAAGELGYETDTAKFKLGNATDTWDNLPYAGVNQTDIQDAINALLDGAPSALDTLNELAAALGDDANFSSTILNAISNHASATTNVHGIANTAALVTATLLSENLAVLENNITNAISFHESKTTNVHGILDTQVLVSDVSNLQNTVANVLLDINDLGTNKAALSGPVFTGTVVLPSTTSIGDVSATEISYLNNVTSAIQTQINAKANIDSPEFTGTVVLPSTTSIGDVSAAEISYLNNVTSSIQTQIDGKLDSGVASTTYAALAGATFTGNVVLTANTSIGSVDSTEISYLNGVTSAIQTQLDAKAPTASPTFTGTVSGITKSMVGLGNVDNTSDADKPISNAVQAALNAKAALAGATFTGDVTVETNLIVDGNLTVSGTTTTVNAQDLVVSDPLIYIGEGNNANLVDLGLVSSFNDGTYQHSGIVRDSSAGKWKLFKGVTDEPTTTVNFAQGSLDDLAVNNVEVAGVVFTDGTQTKQGVPSITAISQKTDSYTLSSLTERDTIIEINKATATTLTIPANASVAYPVGTTLDIIQTGAGQVTIAGAGGVTVNATPGLKLRTQWSSATLLKRGENTWLVYGDLTA